jgi:hypothetical protein
MSYSRAVSVRRQATTDVVINGQRFAESDETTYIVACDVLRGAGGDVVESANRDHEGEPHSIGEDGRFASIARIMEALERRMGHERCIAWLVTPSLRFAGTRPLDLVAAKRGAEVLEYIQQLESRRRLGA